MSTDTLLALMGSPEFWRLAGQAGAKGLLGVAPGICSWAVTTGDAATTETVAGVTTSQVAVWLDGDPQDAAHKRRVMLPYGVAAPAAGQLWIVLWQHWPRQENGVLLLRLA